MITERMLRDAAAESCEIYVACLEQGYDPENQHVFSEAFEKKLKRLKRKANHPVLYGAMHRVASIVLAMLIIGGAWLTVDAEARAAFVGWVKETYEMFFVYHFSGKPDVSVEKTDYRPAWIPDGYSEFMTIDENGGVTIVYKNEVGKRMKLGYIHDPNFTGWYFDTKDTIQLNATVNGNPADILMSTSDDVASIVMWTVEDHDVAFYVSGFLDNSQLIQVAESLHKMN